MQQHVCPVTIQAFSFHLHNSGCDSCAFIRSLGEVIALLPQGRVGEVASSKGCYHNDSYHSTYLTVHHQGLVIARRNGEAGHIFQWYRSFLCELVRAGI